MNKCRNQGKALGAAVAVAEVMARVAEEVMAREAGASNAGRSRCSRDRSRSLQIRRQGRHRCSCRHQRKSKR